MIDTICLSIPKENLKSDNSFWTPAKSASGYIRYINNISEGQNKDQLHFPKLTALQGKKVLREGIVKIEFSVPKLLFSNNLEELEERNFQDVIDILQERLRVMGVEASQEILKNAPVSSIHFSKNILLSDGYTASHLISQMNKVNLPKVFDMTRSRYINDGQSLYAHTKSHELIIYDKIADLKKQKGRAIDKDQTLYQKSLSEELKKEGVEVIRFEVRLIRKRKMNFVLKTLGYNENPTFQDVFNSQLSKDVVTDYWNKLIKANSHSAFNISLGLKDVLQTILMSKKEIKPKEAIYLTGLYTLSRDQEGMRELRSLISKNRNERTWYRMVKNIEKVSSMIAENKIRDWVKQIDGGFEDYKPYRI